MSLLNLGSRKDEKRKKIQLTEEEEKNLQLVDEFFKKFEISRQAKQPFVETWNKCIDAYNSDYFKMKNKPDYKSDEISNFIFSTLETIKPIMMDNDPQIQVLPCNPNAMKSVSIIENIFKSEWQRDKMSKKLGQAITVALQIGTAVIMNSWNGKDDGIGNVNNIIVNPYNLFPDPMASDIDSCEYLIYATYKHVNQLRHAFPSKANLLEGGTINFPELVSQGNDTSNVTNQVLVLECYTRDYTTIETEETDDDGNKVKKQVRKYKNGRILTIAPELKLILADKELIYEDGKFPFELIKCYDVPFQFWGKGEIEHLLSPQEYINDLVNQVIDNAKLTANMPWLIDKNAGIGKGQLTNRPGLIVRKNPGSDVKRLAPPPMPNYVQELIETLKRDIEIISGIHDVTQGRKPGSISAASAIMALQEAAQARIRLKVRLMELSLSSLGKMWFSRIRQFWKTERWVRFFDKDNNVQFVEVSPEDLQVDVDFFIVSGSTMPQSRPAMFDLMVRLAQTMGEDGLPMVDRETVLEYANVPNKRRIVEKFGRLVQDNEQKAQAQSEQEQQMLAEQQAQEIASKQMMAEQQHRQKMQQTLLQGKVNAEATQPTDLQIESIINTIIANPQLLDIILSRVGMSQGLGSAI